MLEIKTIESEKYERIEGTNRMRFVGMITAEEAFDQLYTHLEKMNLLPDEYFGMEFTSRGKVLPKFRDALCYANWGGSEGVYVDVFLSYDDVDNKRKLFHLATGKTLAEGGDAYLKMSRIATECSMMLNGRGSVVKVSEYNYQFEPSKKSLNEMISEVKNNHVSLSDIDLESAAHNHEKEPERDI